MDAVDGRIVVLAGGLSHERDVSLRSGRRVAEALRDVGAEVEERDVDASLLPSLREDPPACVVPLLHGETGEDGALREVLELVGVPYVGAPPDASRAAFDKPIAKTVVGRHGLHTPPGVTLPHETFRELGASAVMTAIVEHLGLPLIVKPTKGGSALGCSVVREE
ncbi:MAG TPA: D-alanine--D-alanine ligase, partial [Nocardioidaceae bacterium]